MSRECIELNQGIVETEAFIAKVNDAQIGKKEVKPISMKRGYSQMEDGLVVEEISNMSLPEPIAREWVRAVEGISDVFEPKMAEFVESLNDSVNRIFSEIKSGKRTNTKIEYEIPMGMGNDKQMFKVSFDLRADGKFTYTDVSGNLKTKFVDTDNPNELSRAMLPNIVHSFDAYSKRVVEYITGLPSVHDAFMSRPDIRLTQADVKRFNDIGIDKRMVDGKEVTIKRGDVLSAEDMIQLPYAKALEDMRSQDMLTNVMKQITGDKTLPSYQVVGEGRLSREDVINSRFLLDSEIKAGLQHAGFGDNSQALGSKKAKSAKDQLELDAKNSKIKTDAEAMESWFTRNRTEDDYELMPSLVNKAMYTPARTFNPKGLTDPIDKLFALATRSGTLNKRDMIQFNANDFNGKNVDLARTEKAFYDAQQILFNKARANLEYANFRNANVAGDRKFFRNDRARTTISRQDDVLIDVPRVSQKQLDAMDKVKAYVAKNDNPMTMAGTTDALSGGSKQVSVGVNRKEQAGYDKSFETAEKLTKNLTPLEKANVANQYTTAKKTTVGQVDELMAKQESKENKNITRQTDHEQAIVKAVGNNKQMLKDFSYLIRSELYNGHSTVYNDKEAFNGWLDTRTDITGNESLMRALRQTSKGIRDSGEMKGSFYNNSALIRDDLKLDESISINDLDLVISHLSLTDADWRFITKNKDSDAFKALQLEQVNLVDNALSNIETGSRQMGYVSRNLDNGKVYRDGKVSTNLDIDGYDGALGINTRAKQVDTVDVDIPKGMKSMELRDYADANGMTIHRANDGTPTHLTKVVNESVYEELGQNLSSEKVFAKTTIDNADVESQNNILQKLWEDRNDANALFTDTPKKGYVDIGKEFTDNLPYAFKDMRYVPKEFERQLLGNNMTVTRGDANIAKKTIRMMQKGLKELMQVSKQNMVMKNPASYANNFLFNYSLNFIANGADPVKTFKATRITSNQIKEMQQLILDIPKEGIAKDKAQLTKRLEANTVYQALEAGVSKNLIEGVERSRGNLAVINTDKGGIVNSAISEILATPSSKTFSMLQDQMGGIDFNGRMLMYNHFKDSGLDNIQSAKKANELYGDGRRLGSQLIDTADRYGIPFLKWYSQVAPAVIKLSAGNYATAIRGMGLSVALYGLGYGLHDTGKDNQEDGREKSTVRTEGFDPIGTVLGMGLGMYDDIIGDPLEAMQKGDLYDLTMTNLKGRVLGLVPAPYTKALKATVSGVTTKEDMKVKKGANVAKTVARAVSPITSEGFSFDNNKGREIDTRGRRTELYDVFGKNTK